MTVPIYIFIIAIIIVSISIYIAIIQRRKAKLYRDLYENIGDDLDGVETQINVMLSTIKAIDAKGMFEADDEVGVVFKSIKDILIKYFDSKEDDLNK